MSENIENFTERNPDYDFKADKAQETEAGSGIGVEIERKVSSK